MLNLKELKFSYKSEDWQNTFVGIKKSKSSDDFEFQLPKGFDSFPTESFTSVKNLFFKTYKTYRKFFEEKKKLAEDSMLDGFSEVDDGYKLEGKDGQTISYSKLNMLDSILDAYNELLILSIKNKLSRTNEIDYSKIHKYLHKAIFIDEETVFIDEMEFPKKIIDSDCPVLIQMFCFIYSEIKQALEEEFESNRVKSLATEFRDSYLTHDSSIFEEETFDETMAILKDVLDEVDRATPYKDADYWHFYDAVYKFLYGENEESNDEEGKIWGISNFAILWEELCFSEAKQRLNENQLLFADRIGIVETFNQFKNPFFLQINAHRDKKRKLRPDLVISNYEGAIDIDHLQKVYTVDTIKIGEHVNVKLTPRIKNHEFYEIDNIYLKYVSKNPKHIQYPSEQRFLNVASIHRNEFFSEVNDYFNGLTLNELMSKRPCIFKFTVIDYKYIAEETCTATYLSEERKLDIQKQLVYEFALQLNFSGSETNSEFWIPCFFIDDKDFQVVLNPHRQFTDAGITIYKRNFLKLQEVYLAENE